MYTISEIEDAIIARLKNELPYLKTCESIGEYLTDEAEDITIRFPAAYVVYGTGSYSYATSGVQDRSMTFWVRCMAKNLRGDRAARHGQGAVKGVYEMLDDVRTALTNQSCGLQIDPLLPLDEEPVTGSEHFADYGIGFETRDRGIIT